MYICPGCRASPSLGKPLPSPPLWFCGTSLVHGVAPLTGLGLFGCRAVTAVLGLQPFTSIPRPGKRGRGEQDLCAQGGDSEGLHICGASQNAVPSSAPLSVSQGLPQGLAGITLLTAVSVPYPGSEQDFGHGSVYPRHLGMASECGNLKHCLKARCGAHESICMGSWGRLNPLVSHKAAWCGTW